MAENYLVLTLCLCCMLCWLSVTFKSPKVSSLRAEIVMEYAEQFVDAAEHGEMEDVISFLKMGVDVNVQVGYVSFDGIEAHINVANLKHSCLHSMVDTAPMECINQVSRQWALGNCSNVALTGCKARCSKQGALHECEDSEWACKIVVKAHLCANIFSTAMCTLDISLHFCCFCCCYLQNGTIAHETLLWRAIPPYRRDLYTYNCFPSLKPEIPPVSSTYYLLMYVEPRHSAAPFDV